MPGVYEERRGRATADGRSSMELVVELTVVLSVVFILLVELVSFPWVDCWFAKRTPSYWTPLTSIVTTNCCSPDDALPMKGMYLFSFHSYLLNTVKHLPLLMILNCIPFNNGALVESPWESNPFFP